MQEKTKNWSEIYIILIVLSLFGYVAFSPALSSWYISDDFYILSICKYIESPIYLFGDHFPYSFYYRPLALLLEWILLQLFGLNNYIHYLASLLIHVTSALILYKLLEKLSHNVVLSAFISCLFLVHPATISTILWMSNRFDSLATLFILASILFIIRYVDEPNSKYFIFSLAATGFAILSKEVGYTIPLIATFILIVFPGQGASAKAKMVLLLSQYLLAAILLLIRYSFLNKVDGNSYDIPDLSLWANFMGGYNNWLQHLSEYIVYYDGIGQFGKVGQLIFLVLSACYIGLVSYLVYKRNIHLNTRVFLLGLFIMLLPGVISLPVTSTYEFPSPADYFQMNAVVASRFYYLSFIGLSILLCSLKSPIHELKNGNSIYPSRALFLLTSLVILLYTATSRSVSESWAVFTNGANRQVIEVTAEAVRQLEKPKGCKIYILNTEPHLAYFPYYIDVAIKSIVPLASDTITCYIQAESTPWYSIVPASFSQAAKFAPLEQKQEPLIVGNLAFVYLEMPIDANGLDAITNDESAIFLQYTDHGVVNVTDGIRTGEKVVRFGQK